MGKKGFAEFGQELHHWAWARNGAIKGEGMAWKFKNQMWNLIPMRMKLSTELYIGVGDLDLNALQRLYYGTPLWFKTLTFSTIGHVVDASK